jgi:hypothetical protein
VLGADFYSLGGGGALKARWKMPPYYYDLGGRSTKGVPLPPRSEGQGPLRGRGGRGGERNFSNLPKSPRQEISLNIKKKSLGKRGGG